MMRDERIRETKNRITSRAFGAWYVLLLTAILYRQFYLGQTPMEYWDIALIFFIGTLYVTITGFATGVIYEDSRGKYVMWTVLVILIAITASNYIRGRLDNIADLLVTLVSALIGIASIGLIFYLLYRRWENKLDLEE